MLWYPVLFLVTVLCPHVHCGQTEMRKQYQMHRNTLLQDYPRDIPPEDDFQIDTIFYLLYIQHLDISTQTFTLFGSLEFQWVDPLLRWNASDPSAPKELQLGDDEIWTPNIVLSNNAQSTPLQPVEKGVTLRPSGFVKLSYITLIQTQCHVDVTRFPFDEQHCRIVLFEWDFKYSEARIVHLQKDDKMGKSVEWTLVDICAKLEPVENVGKNVSVITFHLRREHLFYLLTVIVPVFILSIMNACVFLLPVESGEKISYLISILVTYAVFINFTTEVMPKSGTPTSLGIYLVLVLCESCASILATLWILNLYHSAEKRIQSEAKKQEKIEHQVQKFVDGENMNDPIDNLVEVKSCKTIVWLERSFFVIFTCCAIIQTVIFFM